MKRSLTETKECKIEKSGKYREEQNDDDTTSISSEDLEYMYGTLPMDKCHPPRARATAISQQKMNLGSHPDRSPYHQYRLVEEGTSQKLAIQIVFKDHMSMTIIWTPMIAAEKVFIGFYKKVIIIILYHILYNMLLSGILRWSLILETPSDSQKMITVGNLL
jgi:hypothetical protein